MSGILTLAEMVWSEMQSDNFINFDRTIYAGPSILACSGLNMGRTQRLKNPAHPNLLRKQLTFSFLRVRFVTQELEYRSLLLAIFDKWKNSVRIAEGFRDRLIFVDDPDDPKLDGVTMQKPYLALHDADFDAAPYGFSGQREERIPVEVYIYQQRFPNNQSESLIGE